MSSHPLKPLIDQSTQDLLAQAGDGDGDAWRVLYERYRILLLLAARNRLPHGKGMSFDPEDVLQSAFLSAWSKIKTFEYRGEGSFRSWLARIVVNNAIEKVRQQASERRNLPLEAAEKRRMEFLPDHEARRPSELLTSAEDEAKMLDCLEAMPEDLREVFVMREFERKGWDEIADIMQQANSTVRLKYRKAWTRLCAAVQGSSGE